MNLWSTLLFVHFEKLNFFNFWGPLNLLGPSKKSQLLDSWPLSMPLKTRPWMNLFKNIVLYLLTIKVTHHLAAFHGRLEVCKLIFKNVAEKNPTSDYGNGDNSFYLVNRPTNEVFLDSWPYNSMFVIKVGTFFLKVVMGNKLDTIIFTSNTYFW